MNLQGVGKCRLLLGMAIMVVCLGGCRSSKPGGGAAERKPAPQFSLQDISGKPLALANYRGKVVLVDFWASWCAPCREETPRLVQLQDKYGSQGFQIIGISMDDDAEPVHKFAQEFKLNYPVAVGTSKLADSFGGILGLPVAFLIGRDGNIEKKYVGLLDVNALEGQIKTLLVER